MKDQATLGHTAQTEAATEFRGKLGFTQRDETALSTATTLVVQTLEEFGHEVDHLQHRRAHRITLDCDLYAVELRHRRTPSPLRQADGEACRCQLDVIFRPRFPAQTDEELTELLLARVLQTLLEHMDATTVEWLDTALVMDRATFLSAFTAAEDAPGLAPTSEAPSTEQMWDIQIPVDTGTAAPVGRSAGQPAYTHAGADRETVRPTPAVLHGEVLAPEVPEATAEPAPKSPRFAPVDETFGHLNLECDRIIELRDTSRDGELVNACRNMSRALAPRGVTVSATSAWLLTAVVSMTALPLGVAAAAVNITRGADTRFSLQMLLATSGVIVLQSAGLVQAALP